MGKRKGKKGKKTEKERNIVREITSNQSDSMMAPCQKELIVSNENIKKRKKEKKEKIWKKKRNRDNGKEEKIWKKKSNRDNGKDGN